MKKHVSILLLVALSFVAGCGGGSGTLPGGGNPPDPQVALQVLQDCGSGDFQQFVTLIDAFAALFGNGALPAYQVTSVDAGSATVAWTLMLGTDNLIGSLQFQDSQGAPVVPFAVNDFNNLINGFATLPGLLATVADGTQVAIDFNLPSVDSITNGGIIVTMTLGAPDEATGQVNVQAMDCSTNITFADIDASGLLSGGIPTGATLDITVTGTGGTVLGTVTFNGTETASLEVTLDGTPFSFLLNLSTGAVTLAP